MGTPLLAGSLPAQTGFRRMNAGTARVDVTPDRPRFCASGDKPDRNAGMQPEVSWGPELTAVSSWFKSTSPRDIGCTGYGPIPRLQRFPALVGDGVRELVGPLVKVFHDGREVEYRGTPDAGLTCSISEFGRSLPLLRHHYPKNIVDARRITRAELLKPFEYVGIQTHGDQLLGRAP
jgi:hypothetical protein